MFLFSLSLLATGLSETDQNFVLRVHQQNCDRAFTLPCLPRRAQGVQEASETGSGAHDPVATEHMD